MPPKTTSFVCRICGKTFPKAWRAARHFKLVHESAPKPFRCEHCAARFLSEEARDVHTQQRHANKLSKYLCERCGFSTHTLRKLRKHVKTAHPTPKSELKKKREELRERRKVKRDERAKRKREFTAERRRLSLLTDCVRCGKRFASQTAIREHAESAHPAPARYEKIDTAFRGSCQTWAKQYDAPEDAYHVRPMGEGEAAKAAEKRASAVDLRALLESERRAVYELVCKVVQAHKISKFCIIPHIKMLKVSPAASGSGSVEEEAIFHLRTRQYTASITSAHQMRKLFSTTYTQMRDGAVSRMEDRLFEEVILQLQSLLRPR